MLSPGHGPLIAVFKRCASPRVSDWSCGLSSEVCIRALARDGGCCRKENGMLSTISDDFMHLLNLFLFDPSCSFGFLTGCQEVFFSTTF